MTRRNDRYCDQFNIRGFFRGHQDEKCSFKLVGSGQPYVVAWDKVLGGKHDCASLARDGFAVKELMHVRPNGSSSVAAGAGDGECCLPYFPSLAETMVKPWVSSMPLRNVCVRASALLCLLSVSVDQSEQHIAVL